MAVLLSLLWSAACAIGLVSAAAAIFRAERRVALLRLAGIAFLVAGVLAILSIGLAFILLAAGCFWLAAGTAATEGQSREPD